MGCLFVCFRAKHSNLNPAIPTGTAMRGSGTALSSLFQCDDESIQKGEEGQRSLLPREFDIKELREEAKFLKACGTLPQTPVELRKSVEKWEDKLHSLMDSPSSCITDGQDGRRNTAIISMATANYESTSETSVVPQQVSTPIAQCKAKYVRFKCDSEYSAYSSIGSSESLTQSLKPFVSVHNRSVTKPSPCLTPLKLADEVQTPDTEFSVFNHDGKITRVGSQYLYLFSKKAEGPHRSKDEYSNSADDIKMREPWKEDDVKLTAMAESAGKEISVGKEEKIEGASLSDWFKPVSQSKGGMKRFGRVSRENSIFGSTPGDRPILGMMAAHWNENKTSHIPLKWWDGNGIPNSTNKYKEDQKVSWHAMPFEERLEKALSEETFICKRKPIGMMTSSFDFNECEESDTAFS